MLSYSFLCRDIPPKPSQICSREQSLFIFVEVTLTLPLQDLKEMQLCLTRCESLQVVWVNTLYIRKVWLHLKAFPHTCGRRVSSSAAPLCIVFVPPVTCVTRMYCR